MRIHRAATGQRTTAASVRLGITVAGLALLDDLREPILACLSRQLGHLTRQQLNELAVLLHEAREPHEADDSAWK